MTTYYYYDFSGNVTGEYRQIESGDLSNYLNYDSNGSKVEKTSINGQVKTITTGTDDNGNEFVSSDGVTVSAFTDDFGRTTNVKTSRGEGNTVFFTEYEYANGIAANSTTNLVSKLNQRYGADELVSYQYTYDGNGNISQIYENGILAHKYTYDNLNQLKEEYDYINNFYINYSYDLSGNIQSKNQQHLSSYGYPSGSPTGNLYYYNDTEWKDKLTKINQYTITYDEIGNPLSYRDGMSFTWESGRTLKSISTDGNTVNMKYDCNGMRVQKSDDNGTTYYYYDSDNNLIGLTNGTKTLLFYYDSDGNVTSFKYGGTMYYYVKNLQGYVVKIINQVGTEIAGYVYDAWGNIQSRTGDTALGSLNPFRYRGYVYDEETGLYYLQSRYYDPTTGRFLNADVYCDTQSGSPLSTNMFAYCENNAVNNIDPSGDWYFSLSSYYNYYKHKYSGRPWFSFQSNYKKLKKRYDGNQKILNRFSGYIYGQGLKPVKDVTFGTAYCKVSSNGCGLAAVYNVMKKLGKYQSFLQVVLEAELNDMLWLNGTFGVKDETIPKYFKAHNVDCKKYETTSSLKKNISKYKITIIYVTNDDGISRHYYCIFKQNGKYYTLNRYNNSKGIESFKLSDINKNHFIRAFCFK